MTRQRPPRAVAGAAVVVAVALVSSVVVLWLLDTQRVTVSSRAELSQVTLGRPVAWVVQDQRRLDPRFSSRVGLDNPWESPVDIRWAALLSDLVMMMALLLTSSAVVLAAVRITRRRRHDAAA